MQPTAEKSFEDRFPYGWRTVKRQLPDGTEATENVPLTLKDVLHPREGDIIPERPVHVTDRGYLTEVFRTRAVGPPVTEVTSDLLIDFGLEGIPAISPDVAVLVELKEAIDPDCGTLRLADSGGHCLLTVEVVSPNTRENDVVNKVELYHRAEVPWYVLIDQERLHQPRRVRAFRWQPDGYEEQALDEQGRFLLPALQLYLSVRDGRAVCHDAEMGRELGDYTKVSRDLEEMERRDQEREREMETIILQSREDRRLTAEANQAREESERKTREANQAREESEKREREAIEARKESDKARENAEAKQLLTLQANEDLAKQLREMQDRLRQLEGGPGPAT